MRDRLSVGGLVLPGVGWLVLFFLIPLGFIVVVSLGDHDRFGRVLLDSPSLDNYRDALDPVFLRPVWNGLRYAALTTIFCLVIGYPIAYWISRYGGANKTLLLVLVMLPFWTSYLIRTYAWKTILGDNGVVNSILQTIGLTHEPIILLNTDIAVIIGMTYGFVPFAILPDPWPDALAAVRDAGFQLLALTPAAGAGPLPERAPAERTAVMLGAEGPGLTPGALAAADLRVRIPMAPGVDSLNVATAAAVAFARLFSWD
jgi:spermidine/putrescine transport system permease protein